MVHHIDYTATGDRLVMPVCFGCGDCKALGDYSSNQLKKKGKRRCQICALLAPAPSLPSALAADKGKPDASLVPAPQHKDSTRFLGCNTCHQTVSEPLVCGACLAVCYCSPGCQASDRGHPDECPRFAAHMQRDVTVSLPGAEWLAATMRHRGDTTVCEILANAGVQCVLVCAGVEGR